MKGKYFKWENVTIFLNGKKVTGVTIIDYTKAGPEPPIIQKPKRLPRKLKKQIAKAIAGLLKAPN